MAGSAVQSVGPMKGGESVGLPVQCSWHVAKVFVNVIGAVRPAPSAPGSSGLSVVSAAPKAMLEGRRMKCHAFASTTRFARPFSPVAGSAAVGFVMATVLPCWLTQSLGAPERPREVHSLSSSNAGSRSICCTTQSSPPGCTARSLGSHSRVAPPRPAW
ncbi:MAG TPA: hypothetical protein DEF51_32125 [Myxococcales bacterium]|nr:hypothetical protein [Myxococcales bacterium]